MLSPLARAVARAGAWCRRARIACLGIAGVASARARVIAFGLAAPRRRDDGLLPVGAHVRGARPNRRWGVLCEPDSIFAMSVVGTSAPEGARPEGPPGALAGALALLARARGRPREFRRGQTLQSLAAELVRASRTH